MNIYNVHLQWKHEKSKQEIKATYSISMEVFYSFGYNL